MATTAIIAEILIIGLEALIWMLLGLLAALGPEWLNLERLERWQTLATILAIAAAYVLGVLMDRLSDSLLDEAGRRKAQKLLDKKDKQETELDKKKAEQETENVGRKRTEVMVKLGGAIEFLEYQRSRMRIARATVLNLLLAIPTTAAFLAFRAEGSATEKLLWVLLTTLSLLIGAGSSYAAYTRIYAAYIKRLKQIHSRVTES